MTDERPRVSVVVPARNEAEDIGDCLRAILAQTRPPDEIIVVDGASTDATAAVAAEVLAAWDGVGRVVTNPEGSTPSNLNRGLAEATGEVVCRVDARSLLPPGYVEGCAAVLASRPDVAVTGGAQVAVARDGSALAVGIARALNNRWGMGLARYRRAATSGPADTVYLGCFRAADLRAVGGWDERLGTNQDFDLNQRLAERGVVWFDAGLEVGYRPRTSLRALARQYHRFGRWKVRYWRLTGTRPAPRQWVLLGAPVAGLAATAVVVRRRGWRRAAAGALVLGGAAGFEVRGATRPVGGADAHAVSLLASAVIAGAWTTGVWREVVRGGRG